MTKDVFEKQQRTRLESQKAQRESVGITENTDINEDTDRMKDRSHRNVQI